MPELPEPLVSVIMPAYNAGRFIAESIESVITQTHRNWELLIVDDGSTDGTKNIVLRFISDKRIKYFYQPNGKQGKARNLALLKASGAYIAFLDADDIWLPEKLKLQLEEIQSKDVDLVFCDAHMFDTYTNNPAKLMGSGKGFYSGDSGIQDFLAINKIPILTVLIKSAVLKSVNGFSENMLIQNAEDYHLWLKLLINGYTFFGSDDVLARYRMHSTSSSGNDKLAIPAVVEAFEDLKKNCKVYSKLISQFQKKWFNRYHYSTNNWNGKDYKELIKKNCTYLKKAWLVFLFNTTYSFTGIRVTRKVLNRMINY